MTVVDLHIARDDKTIALAGFSTDRFKVVVILLAMKPDEHRLTEITSMKPPYYQNLAYSVTAFKILSLDHVNYGVTTAVCYEPGAAADGTSCLDHLQWTVESTSNNRRQPRIIRLSSLMDVGQSILVDVVASPRFERVYCVDEDANIHIVDPKASETTEQIVADIWMDGDGWLRKKERKLCWLPPKYRPQPAERREVVGDWKPMLATVGNRILVANSTRYLVMTLLGDEIGYYNRKIMFRRDVIFRQVTVVGRRSRLRNTRRNAVKRDVHGSLAQQNVNTSIENITNRIMMFHIHEDNGLYEQHEGIIHETTYVKVGPKDGGDTLRRIRTPVSLPRLPREVDSGARGKSGEIARAPFRVTLIDRPSYIHFG
ncbi:hypothetical protein CONPUDRAFT_77114 [Coniophora puteana RWD-64-598 SS2]|uniref:Uncharacterized protein n=1 Tax=Coniophora puteana (strain RWD-64-598) TaxID=741705 RepID=A0A5M3M9U3_CONPW|nr:uncharacterized protein CONPUDRAFT_77114 [Coniophora puteana RWD-64-598 SS2]EIW75415.1 hypothetical protein CONPUDRAFT_77114 [Coniophora puteana RWD-64-598 SS2]